MQNSQNIYLDIFLRLIPEYCVNKNRQLVGRPDEWQPQIISYSLYLGLGINILDENFGKLLLEEMSQGMKQTSALALKGLDVVKKTPQVNIGDKWNHAVSFLSNYMSLTSPETTGPTADEEIVKQRAPISGFIPALRLSVEDPEFALELYRDAIHERRKCDADELSARIDFMRHLVVKAMSSI